MLITDLEERSLLDETLIVVMGEFGRTPKINNAQDGGRDHWSRAYSMPLIGGGIRGGVVYGATDGHAGEVADSPVKPDDIAATIYHCMGLQYDMALKDSNGQPQTDNPIRSARY